MTTKFRNLVVGLMLIGLIGLDGGVSAASLKNVIPATSVAAVGSKAKQLEGTWQVQVTLQNCQTGVALRTAPAFLTFEQGGTLVETTAVFSSSQRGPGHGFWEHTGGKTFKAVSKAFVFNPDGTLAGTQTITQSIEFGDDPDVFNSTATTEIVAPNGNVILSGCATAVAHRME